MRTFIAVEIPEQVKEKIASVLTGLKKLALEASWVKKENLHLTLKFLGEVKEEKIEEVYKTVAISVENTGKFRVNLKELGCFPNIKKPRVVWIGIEKGKENLSALSSRLEENLERLGFPREDRLFSAHLTLGRIKSSKNTENLLKFFQNNYFESEDFEIEEVVVMKSTLTPQGAIYSALKKIAL